MEFPKRGEHDFWQNDIPIADRNEALALLAVESSSIEPHYLTRTGHTRDWEWELVTPWYREGSSGADRSGYDYYQIDPVLAKKLVSEGLVEPFVVKTWGAHYADPERLVIVESAKIAVWQFQDILCTRAVSLLIPGIHTDLTGEARRVRSGREHFRFGRYYVDFETPSGDTYRVFPEHDEVVGQ